MDSYKSKRVLVTGATGLIGSNLVNRLLCENATVIAMGRQKDRLESVFSHIDEEERKRLSFVVGNIKEKFPENIIGIDYIFHAASPISGIDIKERPVEVIFANVNGIVNCLEFLKKQGTGRLIVFSSATVYGDQVDLEKVVTELETDRAQALHSANIPYSESKRMIEVLAKAYCDEYDVDSVIARIAYVYGYIGAFPDTAFYQFIKSAVAECKIVLQKAGLARRDNIYVDDVVNALIFLSLYGETGESYNISSNGERGNYAAIDEIANIIAKNVSVLRNTEVEVLSKKDEGERAPGIRLDNTKLKSLGWSLGVGIEEGIEETLIKYMEAINDKELYNF